MRVSVNEDEMFRKAAHWWAKNAEGIRISVLFFEPIVKTIEVPEKNLVYFENCLAEELKEKFQEFGFLIVSVDYKPDALLSKVALETGIPMEVFPWKSKMWIYPNEVRARIR